jgi:two-component system sensor histidine kinase KdpD
MEAGLLKLEKGATNLSLLIKSVSTEANIRASSHRVISNLDTKLPKVIVDAKRIRQVLDNLVDNAIKYSPAETEIVLAAKRAGSDLLISVTDKGPGIPPEELTKIFDRMYRIEERLHSGVEGVGLGLYICQRLIEAHGGNIWAESTVGEGSTILFTIPNTALVTKTI